jgi:hypothetical protein
MVAAPKISIIETRSPSSAFLYSIIFAILIVIFLSYWYWFTVSYGPWFPSTYDLSIFSDANFDSLYPTATETLHVPKKWINGRVYLLDQLAKEASTGYMVVIIPPAWSLNVGDHIEFIAQQTLLDDSADQNLTQYFGFYENTDVQTDFNDGFFAIEYANKNFPATPASHSDKLSENRIELQIFDFGSGKVWVAFGGFSDAN